MNFVVSGWDLFLEYRISAATNVKGKGSVTFFRKKVLEGILIPRHDFAP